MVHSICQISAKKNKNHIYRIILNILHIAKKHMLNLENKKNKK